MRYLVDILEFIGGVSQLAWRVLKLIFSGRVNFALLARQMVLLGVNSIPISVLVLCFAGSVFAFNFNNSSFVGSSKISIKRVCGS